jgi:1,4-dihydroxy-6-naphthoate synthase
VTILRIAHSPDSDDAFMFHALVHSKIDTEGLTFSFSRHDTETLNAIAEKDDADVLAVSCARYATIADRWLLLPHGASVGRGYGPVVVAKTARTLASLEGARIGVPGLRTTATMVLRILLARFEPVTIPITPYERVWNALRSDEVEAALVIHEGRLAFEREGFACICDIGKEWNRPLPLGVNVVRRALGDELIAKASRVCKRSIAWALDHRDEVMHALRGTTPLDAAGLDRYLAMYANEEDTREMRSDVISAMETLFAEAAKRNLLARAPAIELAP